MLPVKVASKLLCETSAVSLFAFLPMPMLVALPLPRHAHSRVCTLYFFLRSFPMIFEEKRGCSQSIPSDVVSTQMTDSQ